ncbi:hypothetical protein L6452_35876 [Arctium lappa]|uniref:Uncharacterized protein n=1 Tax=Arctium lappa TaxID=4217 RepID=A0ACB8Y7U1_ARCLA|nr:hypothetical protein L6452_35876 [Arctium lappa]
MARSSRGRGRGRGCDYATSGRGTTERHFGASGPCLNPRVGRGVRGTRLKYCGEVPKNPDIRPFLDMPEAFALTKKNERNPDNVGMSTLKGYAPSWIRQELWDDLVDKVWSIDGGKAKSKAGKKNYATLVDGSVSKHTCSSVSCAQHRLRLGKKLAREPTIVEVFKETHCKKIISDDGTTSVTP